MATRSETRLKALADEARVLAEKTTPLTKVEEKSLDDILRQAKALKAVVEVERGVDGFTGRVSGITPGEETEDGFQAGIGRISGKSLKAAVDGARAGTKAIVQGGSLLVPAERDPEFYGFPTKPQMVTSLIPTKMIESNDFSYL